MDLKWKNGNCPFWLRPGYYPSWSARTYMYQVTRFGGAQCRAPQTTYFDLLVFPDYLHVLTSYTVWQWNFSTLLLEMMRTLNLFRKVFLTSREIQEQPHYVLLRPACYQNIHQRYGSSISGHLTPWGQTHYRLQMFLSNVALSSMLPSALRMGEQWKEDQKLAVYQLLLREVHIEVNDRLETFGGQSLFRCWGIGTQCGPIPH